MSSVQIVGLGMSTIDILIRMNEMPNWQTGGGRMQEVRMDGGGPVGTGLVAAARLGASVGYLGTYGSDETGKVKLSFLARDGVDVSHVIRRSGPETQIILCYVNDITGERVYASTDSVSSNLLKVDELDRDYITSAEYLHLDGFHHAAAVQAAYWMHEAGKKVMLDAGKATGKVNNAMRELIALTDVLICSAEIGMGVTGKTDIWKAGEELLEIGPQIVVQTDGESGSYTVTPSEHFYTPAFRIPVVDTTGAGDVFHGAYLYGLLQNWDVQRTAVFATAVSAIKCIRLGGQLGIPKYPEVAAFLKERGFDY